jgi:DNA (cytosine-5)-methyltransferase 1
MRAISLFSGAGGLDCGLNQAGIKTVASVELDAHCISTLKENFDALTFHGDVRSIQPGDVLKATGLSKIDMIHGGPPCQPFSQIGARKGLGHRDGALVFEMVRWISELRPTSFIIEQVKGFLKHDAVVRELLGELEALGYGVSYRILNSVNFGVAQSRERVIFTGSLLGKPFLPSLEMVVETHNTVGKVISDLPPPSADGPANHIDKTPARDRERISWVKEGEWLSKTDAPADIVKRLTRKDTTKFRRLANDLPSLTLRCGEIFYHPKVDRYLTPREYLRIHGYPDSHILIGPIRGRTGQVSNLDQHRQVANSVPPPLAKAVGLAMKQGLTWQ